MLMVVFCVAFVETPFLSASCPRSLTRLIGSNLAYSWNALLSYDARLARFGTNMAVLGVVCVSCSLKGNPLMDG